MCSLNLTSESSSKVSGLLHADDAVTQCFECYLFRFIPVPSSLIPPNIWLPQGYQNKCHYGLSIFQQHSRFRSSPLLVQDWLTFSSPRWWSMGCSRPHYDPSSTGNWCQYCKTAMAVAWGDAWTNMIQPFRALPLLANAGLKARDIMGFCVMILIYSFSQSQSVYYFSKSFHN